MWYFAYGHDLNPRSLTEWADRTGTRAPLLRANPQPATLLNHRLAFHRYSEYWGGGVADIVPEPGKQVFGALFSLPPRPGLESLESLHDRRADERGFETGSTRLIDVNVTPYRGGETIAAVAFRMRGPEIGHVPPTQLYVSRMVEAALELDLSAMWVMQLRSFVPWTDDLSSDTFPGRVTSVEPKSRRPRRAGERLAGGRFVKGSVPVPRTERLTFFPTPAKRG